MLTSCLCRMRGRGLLFVSGPASMEQVEVEVDGGLLLVPKPATASPVVWASPAFLFRLVLSLALLVFPCPAVAARVSSSLSTTHHVHHFHNKHGTVPIAINRMPFLTRGGHGKITSPFCFFVVFFFLFYQTVLELANDWPVILLNNTQKYMCECELEEWHRLTGSMGVDFLQGVDLWWQWALGWVHKPKRLVYPSIDLYHLWKDWE